MARRTKFSRTRGRALNASLWFASPNLSPVGCYQSQHMPPAFGDEQKAAHWFTAALVVLGGRSPEEVFAGEGGAETVGRILTRIEHNIPS